MENTKIEWAHHTFNPWEGCAKVSPGCKNCYANSQHQLHHSSLKTQQGTCWGISAPRLGKSPNNWKQPLKWNRAARAAGVQARVFCASMADVFEAQSLLSAAFAGETAEVPTGKGRTRTVRFVDIAAERLRLLDLIRRTPWLCWLLLTKRPENIRPALEAAWESTTEGADLAETYELRVWLGAWLEGSPPANVWLGTSVENQAEMEKRHADLMAAPAVVHFWSAEPLLGAIDARAAWAAHGQPKWVIVGGESGHQARPMHSLWAQHLREQCQAAGVAFFFKQWGEWQAIGQMQYLGYDSTRYYRLSKNAQLAVDSKEMTREQAADIYGEVCTVAWLQLNYTGTSWDKRSTQAQLLAQVNDNPRGTHSMMMFKVGKHEAGRLLDGCTWDEVPVEEEVARV